MKYYKVTKPKGVPLFNGNKPRKIGMVEKAVLNKDTSQECTAGIYYCEAWQLPLWWRLYDTEVREVKPLGEVVKIGKGYRTDKLKHVKRLSKREIRSLGDKHGFDYFGRLQTAGRNSQQMAGRNSQQTAGRNSQQTAGDDSQQTAGWYSQQTAGWYSQQTAGRNSQQTAGGNSHQTAGDDSTQIIYGESSYIILCGKNVITRQIWLEGGDKHKSAVVIHDKLLKKYKKGDKLKIVKGKVTLVKER